MQHTPEVSKVSTEEIIDRIKIARDTLISSLLNDAKLMAFLEEKFETLMLSAVRMEFLKRDLKELKNSPLDLVHYAFLIKDLKEFPKKEIDQQLMLVEVGRLYEKYRF